MTRGPGPAAVPGPCCRTGRGRSRSALGRPPASQPTTRGSRRFSGPVTANTPNCASSVTTSALPVPSPGDTAGRAVPSVATPRPVRTAVRSDLAAHRVQPRYGPRPSAVPVPVPWASVTIVWSLCGERQAHVLRSLLTGPPSATNARLRLSCVSFSPRPSCVASTAAKADSSPSGTSTTAARQALRATSSSASNNSARMIAGHACRFPILDRVCSAWLRACARSERTSRTRPGSVKDTGWRVAGERPGQHVSDEELGLDSGSLDEFVDEAKRGSGVVRPREQPAVARTNGRPPGPELPHRVRVLSCDRHRDHLLGKQ